jgi:hypothetical protein
MFIIGGIAFYLMGIEIYTKSGFTVNKLIDNQALYVDYEGMEKPAAVLCCLLGSISLFAAFRLGSLISTEHICSECEHIEILPSDKKHLCKKCSGSMEVLSGYYERHPDKR